MKKRIPVASHSVLFAAVVSLVVMVPLVAGCGDSGSSPTTTTEPSAAETSATNNNNLPPPPPPPPVTKPVEPAPVKADVGVGAKGRGYGQGFVATPAASYWAAREMIAFRIQIPEAMKLFKATEGRAPRDHEEYMQRIIKENQIPLPQLPEGQRYMYDPKTEELMVMPLAP